MQLLGELWNYTQLCLLNENLISRSLFQAKMGQVWTTAVRLSLLSVCPSMKQMTCHTTKTNTAHLQPHFIRQQHGLVAQLVYYLIKVRLSVVLMIPHSVFGLQLWIKEQANLPVKWTWKLLENNYFINNCLRCRFNDTFSLEKLTILRYDFQISPLSLQISWSQHENLIVNLQLKVSCRPCVRQVVTAAQIRGVWCIIKYICTLQTGTACMCPHPLPHGCSK